MLVSPHWCHGDALAVYKGSKFGSLAEKYGFLVIFPDSPHISDHCWDVSSNGTLSHHGRTGDSVGIVNMVQWTIRTYGADAGRVFATGVSSGAMMTEVLLGAYPDVFGRAVDEVTAAASRLIHDLTTTAPPRDREVEAQKARERARERYARA